MKIEYLWYGWIFTYIKRDSIVFFLCNDIEYLFEKHNSKIKMFKIVSTIFIQTAIFSEQNAFLGLNFNHKVPL